ncbi:hypothetical protein EJP67_18375 [Variovorax guangxiensis]|uniref:Uncharacterized protein n=1 Tax=Variovorax guangxiensis TaxID=1775474 RepID=A0A433MM74_9BURK|nr:hypothetical protein [Variovorax guangxiensis]RUR69027.1 hypothetical protein EJP67_18375 [Variovorax guangxiensis]
MTTIKQAFEAKYGRSAEDPSSAEMLAIFTDGYQAAIEHSAPLVKDAFWEGFNAVDASGALNSPDEEWPKSRAAAAIRSSGRGEG